MSNKTRKRLSFIFFPLSFIILIFLSYSSFSEESIPNNSSHIENKSQLKDVEIEELIDYSDFEIVNSLVNVDAFKQFQEKINLKTRHTKFHGSVLVAYKDQIVFQEEFGYKDPIQKTPLRRDTSYELASVSKQFTAAAILMLAEENCIDIDQSVAHYLPDFKFDNISVRQLLKHTSGLWDYMYITEAFWKKSQAPTNQEVVQLISTHQRNLNFQPGSRFNYNNSNYVVLAALVEKISNISFENFLEERIFEELCLTDSYVGLTNRSIDFVADAFIGYGRGYVSLPASFHNQALGDKGVYASPTDLYRWFKSLKNEEILSQEYVDLMFNQDEFDSHKYGMGFRTKYSKTLEPIIYHNGIWDGYRNGLTYLPNDDLVIIVMSNTQNRSKKYLQDYLINEAKKLVKTPSVQQLFIEDNQTATPVL